MGASPLFCCFKNMKPSHVAITGLVSSLIGVAFLIWGVVDCKWYNLLFHSYIKAMKVLYIIGFVALILVFGLFIGILVSTCGDNRLNKVGRILCIAVLILCAIHFLFILISQSVNLSEYKKLEKAIKGLSLKIPTHDWVSASVPGFVSILFGVVAALCANYLYKVFNEGDIYEVNQESNINNPQIVPNIFNQNQIPNNNNVPIVTSSAINKQKTGQI